MLFLCPSCPVLLSCSQSAYSILTHLFILCGLRSLADRMSQVLRRCKNRCHTQRLVLLRSSTIHAAQLHRMRPHTSQAWIVLHYRAIGLTVYASSFSNNESHNPPHNQNSLLEKEGYYTNQGGKRNPKDFYLIRIITLQPEILQRS